MNMSTENRYYITSHKKSFLTLSSGNFYYTYRLKQH